MYTILFIILCRVFTATATEPSMPHPKLTHEANLTKEIFRTFDDKDEITKINKVQLLESKVKTENHKNNIKEYKLIDKDGDKFTDFLHKTFAILNKYNDTDLELFVTIFNDELRKYHYQGCKFYELTENFVFRKFISILLNTVRNRSGDLIKRNSIIIANKIEKKINEKNVRKLIEFVNSLYKHDSVEMFKIFLVNLEAYREKSRKDLDLVLIIRDGIRTILFDHYTQLTQSIRKELRSVLDECRYDFIQILNSLVTLTEFDSIDIYADAKDTVSQTRRDQFKVTDVVTGSTQIPKHDTKIIKDKIVVRPKHVEPYIEKENKVKDADLNISPKTYFNTWLRNSDNSETSRKYKFEVHISTPSTPPRNRVNIKKAVNWISDAFYAIYPKETKHRAKLTNGTNKFKPIFEVSPLSETRPIRGKRKDTKAKNSTSTDSNMLLRMKWLEKKLKAVEIEKNNYAQKYHELERRMQEKDKQRPNIVKPQQPFIPDGVTKPSLNNSHHNVISGQIKIQVKIHDGENKNKIWGVIKDGATKLEHNKEINGKFYSDSNIALKVTKTKIKFDNNTQNIDTFTKVGITDDLKFRQHEDTLRHTTMFKPRAEIVDNVFREFITKNNSHVLSKNTEKNTIWYEDRNGRLDIEDEQSDDRDILKYIQTLESESKKDKSNISKDIRRNSYKDKVKDLTKTTKGIVEENDGRKFGVDKIKNGRIDNNKTGNLEYPDYLKHIKDNNLFVYDSRFDKIYRKNININETGFDDLV